MVCTGNNGRSPVAELIGRNHLAKIGAEKDFGVISSGTRVNEIASGKYSMGLIEQVLNTGIERGIYSAEVTRAIREALARQDAEAVKPYFHMTVDLFRAEEIVNRTKLLQELGVTGDIKKGKDQTVVRPEVVVIFPVDRRNREKVLAIYQETDVRPFIDVLSSFAAGYEGQEIKNTFGRGESFYRQAIQRMKVEVPIAIDKALK